MRLKCGHLSTYPTWSYPHRVVPGRQRTLQQQGPVHSCEHVQKSIYALQTRLPSPPISPPTTHSCFVQGDLLAIRHFTTLGRSDIASTLLSSYALAHATPWRSLVRSATRPSRASTRSTATSTPDASPSSRQKLNPKVVDNKVPRTEIYHQAQPKRNEQPPTSSRLLPNDWRGQRYPLLQHQYQFMAVLLRLLRKPRGRGPRGGLMMDRDWIRLR